MSRKHEDMSLDELQKAYCKAVAATDCFNKELAHLKGAVDSAAAEYKKLQAELKQLVDEEKENRGLIPEESVILEEIGRRIVLADQPDTDQPDADQPERKPRSRRKVKKDD